MKALFARIIEHAFLSGFVAAREIPAGDECSGVRELAKYKPYPKDMEDFNALHNLEDGDFKVNKSNPDYPQKYALDWVISANLADNRVAASVWLSEEAKSREVGRDKLEKSAADAYVAYHQGLERLEMERQQDLKDWLDVSVKTEFA